MDRRVETVIAFMKANLHRKLTPAEIAETVHLSVARVRQLFKIETGTSLARYLRSLRLKQAKHLFETTFLSVKEVAARVGITGIGYLVREFKKTYRMTPARYAARHRKITRQQ
jgi:transcriptional regulator GlxA family with amidase domain